LIWPGRHWAFAAQSLFLLLLVGMAARADDAAIVSTVPMLPIEREALADPDGVRARLPALIEAARKRSDHRTLALLHLAEANACRVNADWACQRDAGRRALDAARDAGDGVLEVRGLIASARGRIALGDYYAGERELGAAQLALADGISPELSADVYLGYSSLSHRLGKHAVAAEYASRGLAALGDIDEPEMRIRLLRNLSRARAALDDWGAAEEALTTADALAPRTDDPKLIAEIALERARIAYRRGDVSAQLAAADRVLAGSAVLANSQLAGLAWEVRGLAAFQTGDVEQARAALGRAIVLFRELDLPRDERRVLGIAIRSGPDSDDLARFAARYVELDATVADADRAEAAHGFEERLKYAQQELDVVRLQSEAALAQAESASLALRLRYNRLLVVASAVLLVVLVIASVLQHRGNRRLAHALAMRRRALLQTSHELRNALVAVSAVAEQLVHQPLPGKAPDLVQTIRKGAEHLAALAQDLLDRGRIEAGRLELICGPAKVGDIVDQVLSLHAPLAREKGLRLGCAHRLDRLPTVIVDATRLEQVLTNLVGNALKFTDRGGVRVVAEAREVVGGRWQLAFAVEDTGPGIDPLDVDRVFEPFVQSRAGVGHASGAGMGLAISHDLVALMGGRLRFEPLRPHGSRFVFEITVAADPSDEAIARVVPLGRGEIVADDVSAEPLYVVAVDDDPVVLMLYEGLFARFHVHPRLYSDLADALDGQAQSDIDLLIVDFDLGGRSGVSEVQQRLTADAARRPRVAVVSGHPAPERLPTGVDEWLQKPVLPSRLAMLVDTARRAAVHRRSGSRNAA
jgi:signal transduction histidine kinase